MVKSCQIMSCWVRSNGNTGTGKSFVLGSSFRVGVVVVAPRSGRFVVGVPLVEVRIADSNAGSSGTLLLLWLLRFGTVLLLLERLRPPSLNERR